MANVMQHHRGGITKLERLSKTSPTSPGELLTFGWAEIPVANESGERKLYCFIANLMYSRMRFVQITSRADAPALIHCLMAAFEYFGGLPRTVSTSQAPGALWKWQDGAPRWHPLIVDFAGSLGITLQAKTPPAYLHEDGADLLGGPRFASAKPAPQVGGRRITLDYLNRQARAWCDHLNRQPHPATHQPPIARLAEERLAPTPSAWAWKSFRARAAREDQRADSNQDADSNQPADSDQGAYSAHHRATPSQMTGSDALMEFTWGEFTYETNGNKRALFGFVAVLSHSRMRFATFTERADAPALIHCLMAAFEYFGGLPRVIAADQTPPALSVIAVIKDGVPQWHPLISDFANSLGITLRLRTPAEWAARSWNGETINHSMNGIHGIGVASSDVRPVIQGAGRSITLDYLNRRALAWCDHLNRQTHAATHQRPIRRLADERLTSASHAWVWKSFRTRLCPVGADGRFSYRGARYELPAHSSGAGARVRVGELDGQLIIWRNGQRIATLAQRARPQTTAARLDSLDAVSAVAAAAPAAALAAAPVTSKPVAARSALTWREPAQSEPASAPAPSQSAHRQPGHLRNIFVSVAAPRTPEQLRAQGAAEAAHWEWWGAARGGARIVVTRAQKYTLLLLTATMLVFLLTRAHSMLVACIALVTALYFVTGIYKIWLLVRGEQATATSAHAATVAHVATDESLPVYTVLVPLHREGKILPMLVERLKSLDYPQDRLQILLLIEMDDAETQNAMRNCILPSHITPMIMPPGQPRTKPRALNIGLHEARGRYIVIYDAEDRPERDQLRKAVAAFQTLPDDVVCVQGRLNFYNRRQSLLTRMFAVDYAVWYDQFLPGLALGGRMRSGVFVPLGGTSNHFRVETLRQVGGWDPFNVTEDCDLGVRLGRAGLRVAMLDSITWEEAVPRVRPWVKQRSRWIKGYLQTYLVHMRHPLLLLRRLGLRGYIDFQMLVGASCLVMLINPLMWALMVVYIAGAWTSVDTLIESLFPPPLYYPALLSLVIGNFIFFYCNVYTCVRHGYLDLTRYALLTPVYWILMSLGAWAGLISLIRNPFYWAKTEHGASLPQMEGSGALADRMYTG